MYFLRKNVAKNVVTTDGKIKKPNYFELLVWIAA